MLKSENKKPIIKWIVIMAAICVGLLINIAILVWGKAEWKSNCLTLISGWVGFLATVMIGIFTLLQSEKFALISGKNEMMSRINQEREKVLELFDTLCFQEKYINPLSLLVYGNISDKTIIEYKMQVSKLQSELTYSSVKTQTLFYTRNYIDDAIEIIDSLILLVGTYLKPIQDERILYVDSHLSEFIDSIDKNSKSIVSKICYVRNKFLDGYEKTIQSIDECKTTKELEKLKEQIAKENQELRKKADDIIKQDIAKLKENNNG